MAYIPEESGILAEMTVEENLLVPLQALGGSDSRRLEDAYVRWPLLNARKHAQAGVLSGGERKLLAVVRALMGRPRVILLDEPSLGLAPKAIATIFETIEALVKEGLGFVVVEQNVRSVLSRAAFALVLENSACVRSGVGAELIEDRVVIDSYLGGE